ncbi:MAG: peptide deformylase [Vampirovibrionales bacterium]
MTTPVLDSLRHHLHPYEAPLPPTLLEVLTYPHPSLRTPCQPVTCFDADLAYLVGNMVYTLYEGVGAVGLAANQIGDHRRVVVMDTTAKTTRDNLKILINPEIVDQSRNKVMREGCLSFPEYLANVKRAQRVIVKAQNVQGQWQQWEVKHLEAVCVQHEIDHLDAVLMIDRIDSLATDWIRRQPRAEPT